MPLSFVQTLKRLEILNFSFNELKQFPITATSLTCLNLRNNRLTSLDGQLLRNDDFELLMSRVFGTNCKHMQ
jgi:Leucine-rich repeat (LRR) protein